MSIRICIYREGTLLDIESFIRKKYSDYAEDFIPLAIAHISQLWDNYKHLADNHFFEEFISSQPGKFQQRYWEMLLADHLIKLGYCPTSSNKGPDLKIDVDGVKTWIEAIAPLPCDVIRQHEQEMKRDVAAFSPSDAYSLRYTQAFSDKLKKIKDYIDNGIINQNEDAIIIAINSGNLSPCSGRGFNGKTDYPFVVDITYGVGSYYAVLDTSNGNLLSEGIATELKVQKWPNIAIAKAYFRDGTANIISAVIGSNASPETAIGHSYAFEAVYNNKANVKFPLGKLGCTREHFVDNKELISVDTSMRSI